jgi:precorrin-3B synthase
MNAPYRRGACPGLSAPMETGDGLLVRMRPIGTMALDAFANLCNAAQTHGNGIIEFTARGSIQVRGLTAASAPALAADIAALGIAAEDGVPIVTDALAGLDPAELADASTLAATLRAALTETPFANRLAPKVSVAIDGCGALHLDALSADLRLRAQKAYGGDTVFHAAVGGDGATATPVGVIERRYEVQAAIRLLDVIAARGRRARAKDILQSEGPNVFRDAVAELLIDAPAFTARPPCEPIGTYPLRDNTIAVGIGVAFGHAEARVLERLFEAAKNAGAIGMRAAPGRALLAVGIAPEQAPSFAAVADHLGFIVRTGDPRRYVIACAGAPICASANIPARTIAPVIADAAASMLDGSISIHLSGCDKGCAHTGPAAVTIVGRSLGSGLVVNGSVRDEPVAVLSTDALPSRLAALGREIERERQPGQNSAQTLSRVADRVADIVDQEADNG